jgi:hypothetical protein
MLVITDVFVAVGVRVNNENSYKGVEALIVDIWRITQLLAHVVEFIAHVVEFIQESSLKRDGRERDIFVACTYMYD